jgi:transcriptional regulator with XRE-family HTH domain
LRSASWRHPAEFESFPAAMVTTRSDSPDAIGERLRLIRRAYSALQHREKEMGQSEFARLCGIGIAAWNNAETGDNRIGIDNAMAVCRRTGVSLDFIYFGERAGLPHALAVEMERIEKPLVSKRA